MFKRLIVLFTLLILGLFSLNNNTYANQTLELAMVEFAPCFYKDGDEFKGYVLEKFMKIMKKAGYDINCGLYPMGRIAGLVRDGQIDITTVLRVVFEDDDIVASEKALYHIKLRSYKLASTQSIQNKEDLKGKRVGLFRGFTYNGLLDYIKDPKNNVQYYEVGSHKQLFQMLALGRLDYVLDYRAPSEGALESLGMKDIYYDELFSQPVHMLVSKSTTVANPYKIVANINKAYAELLKSKQMVEEM